MIRTFVKPAVIGNITQGTIFSGAVSDVYPNYDVWGIVVSARCDIAQKKNPCYFYLPVLRWKDWLDIELPTLLIDNLEHENEEALKRELRHLELSPSIVGRLSLDDIEKVLVSIETPSKQSKIKSAMSNVAILRDVALYNSGLMTKDELVCKHHGVKKSQIDLLLKNANPNYYFFEINETEWYIIRMKEIRRLTKDVFFRLADGIDTPINDVNLNDLSRFKEGDLYMPLYEVLSPYIEHIMQHFVNQFNKIGVEDVSDSLKNKIHKSI